MTGEKTYVPQEIPMPAIVVASKEGSLSHQLCQREVGRRGERKVDQKRPTMLCDQLALGAKKRSTLGWVESSL